MGLMAQRHARVAWAVLGLALLTAAIDGVQLARVQRWSTKVRLDAGTRRRNVAKHQVGVEFFRKCEPGALAFDPGDSPFEAELGLAKYHFGALDR